MKNIIDIIESAVSELRDNYVISNIVDNSNNTYTVTVLNFENKYLFLNLLENEVVTISNTLGFNGKYKIFNLDSNNNTFEIKLNSGVSIPVQFGTVNRNAPYYLPDYIPGLNEQLTNKNLTILLQRQKFPLFYLSTDFEENVQYTHRNIRDLTIYIINTTQQNKFVYWRHENTFPYLRNLELKFLDSLEKYCTLLGKDYKRKEIFYGKPNKNLSNEIVDAIRLTLNINF